MRRCFAQTPRTLSAFKRVVHTHVQHETLRFDAMKDTIRVLGPSKDDVSSTTPTTTATTTIPGLFVFHDFVDREEERCLLRDVEPDIRQHPYEMAHWDSVIAGHRELACRSKWSEASQRILERVRRHVFRSPFRQLNETNGVVSAGETPILPIHVLDIARDGYMRPHVDSVKFSGGAITGLNLLSPVVITLQPAILDAQGVEIKDSAHHNTSRVPPTSPNKRYMTVSDDDDDDGGDEGGPHTSSSSLEAITGSIKEEEEEGEEEEWNLSSNLKPPPLESLFDQKKERVQVLLRPRTLYVMAAECRYDWTHGIEIPSLHGFGDVHIPRKRRIVIMMRDGL